jgi:hypothetical protein
MPEEKSSALLEEQHLSLQKAFRDGNREEIDHLLANISDDLVPYLNRFVFGSSEYNAIPDDEKVTLDNLEDFEHPARIAFANGDYTSLLKLYDKGIIDNDAIPAHFIKALKNIEKALQTNDYASYHNVSKQLRSDYKHLDKHITNYFKPKLKELFRTSKLDPNYFIFHAILKYGDVTRVEVALDAGADANVLDSVYYESERDRRYYTPLHYAVKTGNQEIVKLLISGGS